MNFVDPFGKLLYQDDQSRLTGEYLLDQVKKSYTPNIDMN
jgi:hypothetical protein